VGRVPDVYDAFGVWTYVLAAILVVVFAAFVIWVQLIKRHLGPSPPDRPGHETERFRFKYGGDPPGWE
jgi:hypothetical protein